MHDLLEAARTERADHPAVVDPDGTLSYVEFAAAVDRSVRWLRDNGIVAGQRVLYAGEADRRFLALCYATVRLGAIFVPVHPELTAAQLTYIAGDCAAALVIRGTATPEADGRVVAVEDAWQAIARTAPDRFRADVAADDTALLIYTSGTTGHPKGVVCPHRQVVAATLAINACLQYRPDDVVLCRLPLSFDYGLYQALLCALVGATLVLATQRGQDPLLLRGMVRHGVTVVPLVPSLAQMLILLQQRYAETTRVRLFTNTGARLGRETVAALLDRFPGARYASMYGMTECKRISILDVEDHAAHPDSVGRPIPGNTVRIVDADKREVPPGTVGEIVVRGATVMAGYWRVPWHLQERFVRQADGSLELHTGDQGYLDPPGRLYFVGRDDDIIKRRGIRVSLTEIENAAELIPGVTAAVALRPEPDGGPLRLAVRADLPVDEVRAQLAVQLDPARLPDRILPIAAVPLTPNGKPDAKAVRHLLDMTDQPPPRRTAQRGTTNESVGI